jgi:tetratricopeptide (TPR) repeat protein
MLREIRLRVSRMLDYPQFIGSAYLRSSPRFRWLVLAVKSMHSMLAKTGLLIAITVYLGGRAFSIGAPCVATPALDAKVQAHPDVPAYTDLGMWFGDRQQYNCAIEAFRAALKLEPGSARLYYLIGLSLFSSGHPDEAVTALQRSIQLIPDTVKPHLILGAALAQLHRNAEAKAEWATALNIDPHSTEALDFLSKMLVAEGDYGGAIALLRSVPRDENLALRLAFAYEKIGDLDGARDVLKTGLRTKPGSLPMADELETILVKQSLFQDAIRQAAKTAQLHPGNLEAERNHFRLMVLNDDYSLAGPLGRKLLLQAPHDFEVLYLNGVMERAGGQFPAARKHLEEAVALDPKHYNARYNLGVVLAELKQNAEAKGQLENAIALGASEPQIRFKLASVLRALGDTAEAQEQLKLYQQELQDQNNRTLAASKAAQGDKEMAAGDPQKAVALYREAVGATPNNPLLTFKLVLALDRTGAVDEELALLKKTVQSNPGFALAQNQLGYLASRGGDSAAAEEHFRRAVQAAPGYVQAWVSLAATLGMESRFPEAQQALASALQLDPQNAEALQLRKDLDAAQAQH